VDLGFGPLARLLVAELAVVEDLAHWRPFVGGHLDQVELSFAGHLQGLGGRDDPELFSVDPDQADRTDADLLVDPLPPVVLLRMTVERRNALFSLVTPERGPPKRRLTDDGLDGKGAR
jgi:hypothetical protein